jgi:hypothetical protein
LACSKSPEAPASEPSSVVTPDVAPTPDKPHTLVPADFAALKLGDRWKAGEPIIFYWQSTLPPAGNLDAYLVETDGSVAIGSGPFPGKEKPVESAQQ